LKYFIGIDSGATSTEVLIAADGGKFKLLKRFDPVNYNLLGLNKSARRLTTVIKKSLRKIPLQDVRYIAACVSGAGTEKIRKKLRDSISRKLEFKKVKIYPDTEGAFASVFNPDDSNCGVLIGGTGSVLFFKKKNGDYIKIGGWGRHIGDEGGGFWIAREALGKVTQHYDKRVNKTHLAGLIEKKFRINSQNIVRKIYHNNFEVSKITKLVFRSAENGDRIAKDIIMRAAEHISLHLKPVKNIRGEIALCGSLFSKEKLLEKYLRQIAEQKYPKIKFVKPRNKPVWGALKLAKGRAPDGAAR
jgi:N-acetylglucosamine kinase-like BadF-type ATPase